MKKKNLSLLLLLLLSLSLLCACGEQAADASDPAAAQAAAAPDRAMGDAEGAEDEGAAEASEDASAASGAEAAEGADASAAEQSGPRVAGSDDMTTVEEVVEPGMTPVYAGSLKDGSYPITVKSSSSMFRITDALLTVENGQMRGRMTMSGKSYPYVYMGTAEQADRADPSSYIPYEEDASGAHTFTIPVEALDSAISCAAFSKNKELWYDRSLLFRADSLPAEAFSDDFFKTSRSLGLGDGRYVVDVSLSGGSGKAHVQSPAVVTVRNGEATVDLEWSSGNYDYMLVDGTKYLPENNGGNSLFRIPLRYFDRSLTVLADTTAMSEPHEIEYSLRFDSASLQTALEK